MGKPIYIETGKNSHHMFRRACNWEHANNLSKRIFNCYICSHTDVTSDQVYIKPIFQPNEFIVYIDIYKKNTNTLIYSICMHDDGKLYLDWTYLDNQEDNTNWHYNQTFGYNITDDEEN